MVRTKKTIAPSETGGKGTTSTCCRRFRTGFTLIETILASAILCGAVLVVGSISTRCLTETRLNRQYEVAAALIDKQLTMIDYVGIEDFIIAGRTEGEFEDIEPGYHWKVVTESLNVDYLYNVTITVAWVERGRTYSVSVETMLNGTGLLAGLY